MIIMKRYIFLLVVGIVALGMSECSNGADANVSAPSAVVAQSNANERSVYPGWPETFETGAKGGYADGAVTLSTGVWELDDALVGKQPADKKNGGGSLRIGKTGTVTMSFDLSNGASLVSIAHGVYGSDVESTWQLWYSTNSGSTWEQAGNTTTTSTASLSTATYVLNVTGNVRFQIRKLTGGRLNIDDISIADNGAGAGEGRHSDKPAEIGIIRDDNMAMGNPSGATSRTTNPNNYLMIKPQYALSYNNSRGVANWVSWHLSKAWLGSADRCNCFIEDALLPAGFFTAVTSNYSGSGFDRGHLCPSGDRTCSDTDNARTFLMTNMTPQAPNMNEVTWEALEAYCRKLAAAGNELYIIAGWSGSGGNGRNGGVTSTIADGAIVVPAYFWKIAIILSDGKDDVTRVTTATRVIAVKMPNTQSVKAYSWDRYRTSVDEIESLTGYDFLSNLPGSVQAVIESQVDNGPTR